MATVARVTVVTAGHLSTCPRMLKAADALSAAGYSVRVVSTSHTPWAVDADRVVRALRTWRWAVVDYSRATARGRQLATGVRLRAAGGLARAVGPARIPLPVAARAFSRVHAELVNAIAAEPSDLIYGGTSGALAAIAEAGARLGVRYALDLEDFHSGEREGHRGELADALAECIERQIVPAATFLTASSPLIAEAYVTKYGRRPHVIHNTFSLDFSQRTLARHPPAPMRLYWFSQTIGPGRGLAEVIDAVGRSGIAAELHLRGRPKVTDLSALRDAQRARASRLEIVVHEPATPDQMVALAGEYDLGVSSEEGSSVNRRLCLGNKIFTYLAAGVPVVLSATPAQTALARDLGDAALLYEPGDVDSLATQLRRLADDRGLLEAAGQAARRAAERRWHWEHPADRGKLLETVAAVVPSGRAPCGS